MSAIFLSHSSRDNAAADAMQAWLRARGHQSIFLDFDPANGIPAGRDWEQELYRRLRVCRAVIVLLSEHWLASRWCFAEVSQARALGKAILPVRIAACADAGLLGDVQQIDLTRDPEEGHLRLAVGLEKAGLDPQAMFEWDPRRPPYPGLLALQERDAAVFFGRDEDISAGLDTLNRLRRMAGARLTLFLGASGSGKSSLVRAGLLPRLERDPDNWLPMPPFRPQERPLDELLWRSPTVSRRSDSQRTGRRSAPCCGAPPTPSRPTARSCSTLSATCRSRRAAARRPCCW